MFSMLLLEKYSKMLDNWTSIEYKFKRISKNNKGK